MKNPSVVLSVSFDSKSKTGEKFKEIYDSLKSKLEVFPSGMIITSGYAAIDYGEKIIIQSPSTRKLDSIDKSHPDYVDAENQEAFVTEVLLDAATKHKLLASRQGRDALSQDMYEIGSSGVSARLG